MLVYLLFVLYIFIYFKKLLLAPAPKEEGEGGGESTHDDVKNKSNKEVRSKYVAFMVWAVKILVCFVFRSFNSRVMDNDCFIFQVCSLDHISDFAVIAGLLQRGHYSLAALGAALDLVNLFFFRTNHSELPKRFRKSTKYFSSLIPETPGLSLPREISSKGSPKHP